MIFSSDSSNLTSIYIYEFITFFCFLGITIMEIGTLGLTAKNLDFIVLECMAQL